MPSIPHAHVRRHGAPCEDFVSRGSYIGSARVPAGVAWAGHRRAFVFDWVFAGRECGAEAGGRVGGETDLIAGACAISTPIDLAAGVRRIGRIGNRFYERRFLKRMSRQRVLATGRYLQAELEGARTLYEIDDRITAPSFGFEGADHYYATQSSRNYLERIRVPTLLIQAKDDIFIPFESYAHPAFESNPFLRLIVTERGGHLGFRRRGPRFWVDGIAVGFLQSVLVQSSARNLRA